jgi:hypothetical protein
MGDAVPLATLLSQVKVIAARTDTAPLAAWVDHELHGYPDRQSVPAYRGPFEVQVIGRFVRAGAEKDVTIPPAGFPQKVRASTLFRVWLIEPVADLQDHAGEAQRRIPWSDDEQRQYTGYFNFGGQNAAAAVARQAPGMTLAAATRVVPSSLYTGAITQVRTRILDLALALEKTAPAAGQPDAPAKTKVETARVVNNVHFHGSATNVAIESTNVAQTITVALPATGDEDGLLRYLGAHGVNPSQLDALREALAHDQADAGGPHPPSAGARVKAWMGRAMTDLGTNAAGGVVGTAITTGLSAFFGG